MPTFYVDSFEITVDEFIQNCDDSEIEEIIDILHEEGLISKNNNLNSKDRMTYAESNFIANLEKLKSVYYQMKEDEINLIETLVKKYC